MSLPDFSQMSPIAWVILIAVIVVCAVTVYVVEDEKKKGHRVPGKTCAGCPDYSMQVHTEKEEAPSENGKDA